LADSQARSGDLYLDLDRPDDARDHLGASPRFLDARMRLGALLHRLGDLAGARKEWMLCAEEDPEDRRVQAYLAALDS
jgi:hypothetical protein